MITIPYVLAHFIGDFLLQNDWMAAGKKNSSLICSIHVVLYMIPFIFLTDCTWLQLTLIALQHWIQDRTKFVSWWCNIMGSFQVELKHNTLPWGHFVVDQVFHFVWMYFVINYFFK